MKRKHKMGNGQPKEEKGCENCANCIPIGEGDHICEAYHTPLVVIESYIPSNNYLRCGSRKWVKS